MCQYFLWAAKQWLRLKKKNCLRLHTCERHTKHNEFCVYHTCSLVAGECFFFFCSSLFLVEINKKKAKWISWRRRFILLPNSMAVVETNFVHFIKKTNFALHLMRAHIDYMDDAHRVHVHCTPLSPPPRASPKSTLEISIWACKNKRVSV